MKTTKILAFMGLIPFIVSLTISIQSGLWQLESKQIFITYSAIILSFVAGTLWEKGDKHNKHNKHNKQKIISNLFSLIAFISLLINHYLALAILAISYITIFLYEVRLASLNNQENARSVYLKMRLQLTVIVISFQLTAFILW